MSTLASNMQTTVSGKENDDKLWKISSLHIYRKKIEEFGPSLILPDSLIATFMPKRPVTELRQLAAQKDQQAMLELADMSEFHSHPEAVDYYRELTMNDDVFYPEAATSFAIKWYELFWKMKAKVDKASVFAELPADIKYHSMALLIYQTLCEDLDKCANTGYISAFALIRASEAERSRIWKPSAAIRKTLDNFRMQFGALKSFQFLNGPEKDINCSNPRCKKVVKDEWRGCQLCCRLIYCSLECQIHHWRSEHRRDCQHRADFSWIKESTPVGDDLICIRVKLLLQLIKSVEESIKSDPIMLFLTQNDLVILKNCLSPQGFGEPSDELKNRIDATLMPGKLNSKPTNTEIGEYLFFSCLKLVFDFFDAANVNCSEGLLDICDQCVFVAALDLFESSPKHLLTAALKIIAIIANHATALLRNPSYVDPVVQAASRIENGRRANKRRGNKRKERSTSSGKTRFSEMTVMAVCCDQLVANKLALNAANEFDTCPICMSGWNQLGNENIAIVTHCNHAVCAPCLSRYRSECKVSFETDIGEYNTKFTCTICREKLKSDILYQAAKDLVSRNMIESITALAEHLPLKKSEADHLICNIIVQNHFDVHKIENALFNIVCLSTATEKSELDSDEKREIYRTARQPVKKLEEDYKRLSEKLAKMTHTESRKYRDATAALDRVSQMLRAARTNAMQDIFSQMNSVGDMGTTTDESDSLRLDFHGLHVDEAKTILHEFVFPILPALKRVYLITGRGNHSDSNHSVLKESLRKYIKELVEVGPMKIKCEQFKHNPGILCISC